MAYFGSFKKTHQHLKKKMDLYGLFLGFEKKLINA